MFCRGCGQRRHRLHPAVHDRVPDYVHGRHHLAHVPYCLWHRRLLHDCASDNAPRAPGRGAPQARLSAYGQRAGHQPRGGVAHLYGPAAGHLAGNDLSDSRHPAGALDLSGRGRLPAGFGVRAVYEEVLPPARGVSEGAVVFI